MYGTDRLMAAKDFEWHPVKHPVQYLKHLHRIARSGAENQKLTVDNRAVYAASAVAISKIIDEVPRSYF